MIAFTIPGLRLQNPLNQRVHWRVLSKRGQQQKHATDMLLRVQDWSLLPKPTAERPWDVLIRRVGKGTLDDDAVPGSAKHVRDTIAKHAGVDDRHRHIVAYRYDQRRAKEYAVEVEIREREVTLDVGTEESAVRTTRASLCAMRKKRT